MICFKIDKISSKSLYNTYIHTSLLLGPSGYINPASYLLISCLEIWWLHDQLWIFLHYVNYLFDAKFILSLIQHFCFQLLCIIFLHLKWLGQYSFISYNFCLSFRNHCHISHISIIVALLFFFKVILSCGLYNLHSLLNIYLK